MEPELMGMAVVDQLVDLYLDGLIPSPARMAALLAGDFFALADTRGGFGCVAEVWQVFASQFAQVIGAVRRKRCHIRRISVEGPLPAGLGGGDFVRNFFLSPLLDPIPCPSRPSSSVATPTTPALPAASNLPVRGSDLRRSRIGNGRSSILRKM